jgi:hypothetical protein
MISVGKKRILGLIGAQRSGKDEIARYLEETRGFETLAFADRVKQEFGIDKEDFEAAKVSGNIEEIRQQLWAFSAKIKEKDPLHFIKGVIEQAKSSKRSVVITDIRTVDELNEVFWLPAQIYYVIRHKPEHENGCIRGSKLPVALIRDYSDRDRALKHPIQEIHNTAEGVYYLYQELDRFFFLEDVKDLLHTSADQDIIRYLEQYDVRQTRKA